MRKYLKNLSLLAAIFFFIVPASGCWDSKDINEKLIATTIAFDLKDDEINYYIEYPNIWSGKKQQGDELGSSGSKYSISKGVGETLPESRHNLNEQLRKPPFLSGSSTLILTERFAEEYLLEYLYRFRAAEHYRKKSTIVTTKEDPEKLFRLLNDQSDSLGITIDDLINTLDAEGKSFSRTSTRLIENLSSEYTGILIACIGLQDERLALIGYSVVLENKVVGFIPIKGSNALIFFKGENPKFSYIVDYEDIEFTYCVILEKKTIQTYYEEDEMRFDIALEFKAELEYGDVKVPYNYDDKAKNDIEKILKKKLEKEFIMMFSQAQNEFNCDYLQLDDEFRINYPVEFEKMDWGEEFCCAQINVDVSLEVGTEWMMDYEYFKLK